MATVSFLFVDQVGSTVQLEALGDAGAMPVRDTLFRILRSALAEHEGTEVDHTGDGLMMTFTGASDALRCAGAIQVAVHRQRARRPAEHALRVRIGVHTGETVVNEEGRHFGVAIVIAARLCALADADQILASDVTRTLAAANNVGEFRALEPLVLKGVADPVGVAELLWESPPVEDSWWPLPAAFMRDGQFGFVGREPELEVLRAAWRRATQGTAAAVFVAGEPGIGKTRLAAELAAEVRASGGRVLFGWCDDELGVPYQPFVEALRGFIEHAPIGTLPTELGRHAGELVRLVPELADRLPGLAQPLQSDPDVERRRLFDALSEWLAAAASDDPVLLVLDDLHWATKPTLFLLQEVLRSSETARLMVLGIYRDTDLGRTHPLANLLADLRRGTAPERVSLVGLDETGVAALVQDATGAELGERERELARVIHTETEGNAFFVGEVVRHLVETETLGVESAALGVPEGVREVVGRRLARLSEHANTTLAMSAVIGRDFELAILEAAGDIQGDQLLVALDEAVATRLVEEPSAGRYRFAHALVRAVVYDELRPTRRARLHGRVAGALEAMSGDRVVQLAYHHAQAAAGGDPTKAIEYATRAGDRALAQLAPDEAAAYYRRALDMLDDAAVADPVLSCDLSIALGEAQRRAGDSNHRETLFAAAVHARALGDGDRLARAALANERPWGWSATGEVDEQRIAELRSALDFLSTDDSAPRASLLGHLACELMFTEDAEQCDALSAEGLAIARRLDDDPTLARGLHLRSTALLRTGELAERGALAREALVIADRLGDPHLRFLALMNVAGVSVELADVEGGRAALDPARQIADDLREPAASGFFLVWEAGLAMLGGDFATGERLAFEAFALADQAGDRDADLVLGAQLANLRLLQGRLGELEEILLGGLARGLSEGSNHCMLALLYSETNRLDQARTAFAAAAQDDFGGIRKDPTWVAIIANTAQACARLGDGAGAEKLAALLAPSRGSLIVGGPTIWGAATYYLGILAAAQGHLDEADTDLADAAELHERIGAIPWLARTEVAWARVLLERAQTGDRDRAFVLASGALARARELGLAGTEGEAQILLDRAC